MTPEEKEANENRKAQVKKYFAKTKKQTGLNRYGKPLSEKEAVQSPFVSWFRQVIQPLFPDAILIVNPFADMNFAPAEYYTQPRQKQFKGQWMDAAKAHNLEKMSKAKAEGFEASNPDVIIVFKNGQYNGLAIELKKEGVTVFNKNGSLRAVEHLKKQHEKLQKFEANGWHATFATGLIEAKRLTCRYFNIKVKE